MAVLWAMVKDAEMEREQRRAVLAVEVMAN